VDCEFVAATIDKVDKGHGIVLLSMFVKENDSIVGLMYLNRPADSDT
jgi:hypothetical protein